MQIVIDEKLISDAMKAGPYATKRDAVEAGLKLLARRAAYREILKWRGKLKWEGDERVDWTAPAESPAVVVARANPRQGSAVLVVDSGVWIDFFKAADDPAARVLDQLLDHDHALLHRDRDFDAFEDLRGLRGWQY